ncbi:MAG: outer membrane protein assembly factor BamD [Desulfobacterales bacterium]|nr:outer membrane protein assembly factor BamD [Desulfobacterales bacterium]
MKRLLIISMVLLFACTGCSKMESWYNSLFSDEEEKFAQELAYDAMEFYQEGKYHKAIESFTKLKEWYPFSKYAMLAELKIADAHYKMEEWEDAIIAYEEFERLHPRNEAVPNVVYQIGRCYFDQIETPDRDQTPARKAMETFQRLLQQHPGNEYTNRAYDHINFCLKSMAHSELLVGVFYYKSKHYKGALERFKSVIKRYPDVGVHREALTYLNLCKISLAKQEPITIKDSDQ